MFSAFVKRLLLAGLLLFAGGGFAPRPESADLVLKNGNIITLDAARPRVHALAIRGQRIVAVGRNAEVLPFVGRNTRVIDLKGKTVCPGFIEGHGHFLSLGRSLMSLDLKKARNWNDIIQMVKKAAAKAPKGAWIVGRGWHQEKWNVKPAEHVDGYPGHRALSRVSPDNPVLLVHATGHASFANARAMQLAGVDRTTRDPQGGEILRYKNGEPLGVFRETAQSLVGRAYSRAQSSRSAARVAKTTAGRSNWRPGSVCRRESPASTTRAFRTG